MLAASLAGWYVSTPHPSPPIPIVGLGGIEWIPPAATPAPTPTPLPAARAPKRPPDHRAGFNLLLYGSAGAYRVKLPVLLEQLRADGANSLAVTFPFYQDGASSTEVRAGKDTPSDSDLDGIVRIAQAAGFSVLLRPVMDEASLIPTDAGWRGSIHPSSRPAWFASYGRLIVHYAEVAQRSGADMLAIGTELVSMELDTPSWNQLIGDVRAVYRGQVTYSFANQPNGAFWPLLDFVGIDAYPRLALPTIPTEAQLRAAWAAYARQLQAMSGHKPFVVTEVGVVPDRLALAVPYRWRVTGAEDYQAQATFYAATCDSLQSASTAGIFWWNVTFDRGASQFDPLGTQSEAESAACFARWGEPAPEPTWRPRPAQRS